MKLKMASYVMGKPIDDPEGPDEIQKINFLDLPAVESFFAAGALSLGQALNTSRGLLQILAADINFGYTGGFGCVRCLKMNGVDINNLRHLAELLSSETAQFLKFELHGGVLLPALLLRSDAI